MAAKVAPQGRLEPLASSVKYKKPDETPAAAMGEADASNNFEQMNNAVEGASATGTIGAGAWSNDSFGLRMSRVIRGGVTVLNGPPPSLLNQLLSFVQSCRPILLVLITLGTFSCAALLIAVVLYTACTVKSHSFARLFAMAALQMAGGGPTYIDLNEAPVGCVWLGAAAEYLVLAMQSTLVGLMVAILLKPSVSLVFSDTLAIIKREGKPRVSFRVAHPQGHYVSAFTVKAIWIRPQITPEAEKRKGMSELVLDDHRDELDVPIDLSHTLEPGSPLAAKLAEIGSWAKVPGFFAITCGGYDEVLQIAISGVHWYELNKARESQSWRELVVRSKISAAQEGGLPVVNLQDLGGVNSWFKNDDKGAKQLAALN